MSDTQFRQAVDKLERIIGEIQARRGPFLESNDGVSAQTQAVIEALHTAEEELHVQNEELLSARELVESERNRYRLLFDFAPDAYLVTDAKGIIQEANLAAGRLMNVERRRLTGKSIVSFIASEARREFQLTLAPRNANAVFEFESIVTPRQWEPVPVAIVRAGQESRYPDLGDLRWSIRNIAARKRSEQEIRHLNADLEQRLEERDRFLSNAAHELRTPITTISGYAQLLARRNPDERSSTDQRALRAIRFQSDQLDWLIQQMLEVSRLEQGVTLVEFEDFSLTAMVERVCTERLLLHSERSIEIRPGPEVRASGDPRRVEMILTNLIDNAIRYSDPPSAICVEIEAKDGRGVVWVADQGLGIASEQQPRIFERFFQAHRSSGQHRGGMGIGLSLSRDLARSQGGEIWFTSEPGVGSRFCFSLPLAGERRGS